MKVLLVISALLFSVGFGAAADVNVNKKVLKVLAESGRLMVSQDRVAYEITGVAKSVNERTVYSSVSVGDFLASYIDWTSNKEKPQRNDFDCKGKDVLDCTVQYGLEARLDRPGFGTYLRFQFDRKKNVVIPESLHCITVP